MLRQQVGEHAQLTGCPKSNGARLAVRQHGTASGPRAGTGFHEGLPAAQTTETYPLLLQKMVAGVNQQVVTLTLALREFDGEMDNTMRGEHRPGQGRG